MLIVSNTAMANSIVTFELDYFSKDLDVVNYIDKINTSSIPEELVRFNIDYAYDFGDVVVGGYIGREKGGLSRPVEPLKINNVFTDIGVYATRFNANRKHSFTGTLGHLKQQNITLDCVQRSNILLGGNCPESDFRLLDGDYFESTGERRYLSVLQSDAKSHYAKVSHTYHSNSHSTKFSITTSLDYHYIDHNSDSPLFELTSDFLLDSVIQGQTLRSVISDLKQELPQQTPWHDLVFGIRLDGAYRVGYGQVYGAIGALYSEKIDYDQLQQYKHNTYLTFGYATRVIEGLVLDISGTAYQHYLQGVQPILYTPKTAKFFAYPYAELSLTLHYSF